jgi:hypothetical protein
VFGDKAALPADNKPAIGYFGAIISGALFFVASCALALHAIRHGRSWHDRIPVVWPEGLDTSAWEGGIFQAVVLVLFLAVPATGIALCIAEAEKGDICEQDTTHFYTGSQKSLLWPPNPIDGNQMRLRREGSGQALQDGDPDSTRVDADIGLRRSGGELSGRSFGACDHRARYLLHLCERGLGWNLPASVGVALAERDSGRNRPVITVIGDGSFQYSVQSIWSAAQLHLPMLILVLRNEEYCILKSFAVLEEAPGVPGLDLPGIDIVSVARGYGCDAARLDDIGAIKKAAAKAWVKKEAHCAGNTDFCGSPTADLVSDLLIGAMSCPLNPNDPELTKVNDPELIRS